MGAIDPVIVKIEKLLFGGSGLAHIQSDDRSLAVFVPGAIPGETVRVEIVRRKKNYAEAKLIEVVDPSPNRRPPPCPIFWECGGCDLQQIDDAMQLAHKVEAFREVLARIARLREVPVAPPIPSPRPFDYRFRVQLKVQGKRIGFYRRESHSIVHAERCPIAHPLINRFIPKFSEILGKGVFGPFHLREVDILIGDRPEQILISLGLDRLDPERLSPVYDLFRKDLPLVGMVLRAGRHRHLVGRDWLTLSAGEETLRASEGSFVQANWALNGTMVAWAVSALSVGEEDRVLEIFSGIGNFTLPLARRARGVVGIEGSRSAVKDAKANFKSAGLTNVNFIEGRAEWAVQRLQGRFDRVLIDPPRTGASPAVLQFLPEDAKKLVYLSCHPATLARDLRFLIDRGWRLSLLQPFDMFPQTAHLEVGAVLERD